MYEVRQEILDVAKALGEETRFAIFKRITDAADPLTVKDLVAKMGMHHSAIRIHLNKLEEAGLIVSHKKHKKGVVGRPQLAFLPSPRALSITLPPRNYEFLARLAMDMFAFDGAPEDLAKFGYTWGRSYVRERGRCVDGPLPLLDAIDVLHDELIQLGSSARIVPVDGGCDLIDRNCVFAELAPKYDGAVCRLHQAVMRGMLAEVCAEPFTWEQVSRIAAGDPDCSTRIRRDYS